MTEAFEVTDKVILITKGCVVSASIEKLVEIVQEEADVIRAGTVGR